MRSSQQQLKKLNYIIKGKRLVKVHDLDCDAIRLLQQIFSEIVNALNMSIEKM